MRKSEVRMEKSAIYGQYLRLVPIPLSQKQSGTGTTHQNRVGTGTDPSGTGTTTSCSLDFCIHALISPNSYSDSIGTLIDD